MKTLNRLACYSLGCTIHKIRKPVRVGSAVELPDIHDIVFVLQNSGFIVVHVKIIWRGKDGHDCRELGCSSFAIHAIPKCKHVCRGSDTQHPALHGL
jgi:hypothetical protein